MEFCRDNQIFITTHSPAFYDLSGKNIAKWWVYQDLKEIESETKVEKVTIDDLLDKSLGVAALVAERAREAFQQIEQLNLEKKRLDEAIQKTKISHVIVEGKTDKLILETALQKLYPECEPFCEFIDAGGAPNIPPYLKSQKTISKEIPNIIIGLFDSDDEGRKRLSDLNSKDNIDILNTEFQKISSVKPLYVGLLPLPEDIKNINKNDSFKKELPVPIEFMFPVEIINQAIEEKILNLEDRVGRAGDNELSLEINLSEMYEGLLPENYLFLSKKVNPNCKITFSEWVCNQDADAFKNFKPLFEQIKLLIKQT